MSTAGNAITIKTGEADFGAVIQSRKTTVDGCALMQ